VQRTGNYVPIHHWKLNTLHLGGLIGMLAGLDWGQGLLKIITDNQGKLNGRLPSQYDHA